MDPFAKPSTSKPKTQYSASNPFAKALAETEHSFSQNPSKQGSDINPFSEALARTGGRNVADLAGGNPTDAANSQVDWQKQMEEQERQRKKDALRKKLHDQVNPVDMVDVFSAREKRVQEELEKTREELQKLAQDITKFYKEVDKVTFEEVVSPGTDGAYYVSFFQKLRSFIMLLRQRVKSARTWMNQAAAKSKKKKKKRKGPGLDFGGNQETKTVHDMMHHERSNAYSGS